MGWELSGMVRELVVLAVVGCYGVVVVDGSPTGQVFCILIAIHAINIC